MLCVKSVNKKDNILLTVFFLYPFQKNKNKTINDDLEKLRKNCNVAIRKKYFSRRLRPATGFNLNLP